MKTVFVMLVVILLRAVPALSGPLDDYYLEKFGEGGKQGAKKAALFPEALPHHKCYTPVMKGLRKDWDQLLPETRKILAKYVGRPALQNESVTLSPEGRFRIHYATAGGDAPPLDDLDGNNVPDWVETVANVFDAVYRSEVTEMGYRPPPTFGGAPYDVYLKNIGSGTPSYLGLTDTDGVFAGNSYTSFMTIENDFREFLRFQPLDYLKTTAAHEFHHAIQFGYSYWFDVWYGEATSTWIEDEVFDSINQIYDYLPQYMTNSCLPLDAPTDVNTGGGYGRWIFNRYLAESAGPEIIRRFWEVLAAKPSTGADIPALPILNEVLGGEMDRYFLGFAKRLVMGDWTTHRNEIGLIHPVRVESSLGGVTYPTARYSFAVYDLAGAVDLSGKPANVAAVGPNELGKEQILFVVDGTGSGSCQPPPGSSSASASTSACFIATAAYGSAWDPHVETLRRFRDTVLLRTGPGRWFVSLYYRFSPPVATLVEGREPLRQLVRGLLTPLVILLYCPLLAVFPLAAGGVVMYNHRQSMGKLKIFTDGKKGART